MSTTAELNDTAPRLETAAMALQFHPSGTLDLLQAGGHIYARGGGLWRLYLQVGDRLDLEVLPCATGVESRVGEGSMEWRYPCGLADGGRRVEIEVVVRVRVAGDESHWGIEVVNRELGCVVREVHFPLVGQLELPVDHALITSEWGGKRFADPVAEVRAQHSLYYGCDHKFIARKCRYPGDIAAMNFFLLAGEQQGLYFGCHTQDFATTEHQLRLYAGDRLEAGMVRYPHIAAGATWALEGYVVSAYQGSWHVAAGKYRTWADGWWQAPTPPEWIRRMTGWQRIIMKHQYGEVHYRYADMPQIHADGAGSGFDTLFMFGWHAGGHDNNYPHYEPDPDLGTHEELVDGVRKFREAGGQVILYSSGRLIDTASQFYKQLGARISLKDHLGNEYRDAYKFRGSGNYAGNFANRTFVIACPSHREWYEVLRHIADLSLQYGCQAVFYDQMGHDELPSWEPAAGYPRPWMGTGAGKAALLGRLRAHVKQRAPEHGIGIELLADISAQHADFIHSQWGAAGSVIGEGDAAQVVSNGFIRLFRYTFPEVILSDREIRDDTDVRRRVNHAVLHGLRSDVEIYRCRRTITETPEYAAYLKEVNALRQHFSPLLLEGRYLDTEGFESSNPQVLARAFRAGLKTAVVLTQDCRDLAETGLSIPGARLTSAEALGHAKVDPSETGCTVQLGRDGLAVVVFEANHA